jgi:hypothetical protein
MINPLGGRWNYFRLRFINDTERKRQRLRKMSHAPHTFPDGRPFHYSGHTNRALDHGQVQSDSQRSIELRIGFGQSQLFSCYVTRKRQPIGCDIRKMRCEQIHHDLRRHAVSPRLYCVTLTHARYRSSAKLMIAMCRARLIEIVNSR